MAALAFLHGMCIVYLQEHMTRWCSEGTVAAHNAARLLTFDILVNQALSLKMDDQELQKYSQVLQHVARE